MSKASLVENSRKGEGNMKLEIFRNAEFGEVRTIVGEDGEPWFVGKDVATALGYKDTSSALKRHVDIEDKLSRCFTDSGQSREMYIVNESGLYSLILSSKLESAKRFKKWVTGEVLPSIRKTGSYGIPQISEKERLVLQLHSGDDFLIAQAHKQLVELEKQPLLETIEEQEEVIELQKPKVDFHDTINNTEDTISIGEFATLLSNDLNILVGQNQLFEWFRENGYIKKKSKKDYNMPMGRYVKSGHLKLKEIVIQGTIYLQTRITGKGETYFTDKIIEQGAFGVRKIVDKQN